MSYMYTREKVQSILDESFSIKKENIKLENTIVEIQKGLFDLKYKYSQGYLLDLNGELATLLDLTILRPKETENV